MTNKTAKIVNVIEYSDDTSKLYFTLDGVFIGGFEEGGTAHEIVEKPVEKPRGKVIKPITPQEDKAESERKSEKTLDSILKRKT